MFILLSNLLNLYGPNNPNVRLNYGFEYQVLFFNCIRFCSYWRSGCKPEPKQSYVLVP